MHPSAPGSSCTGNGDESAETEKRGEPQASLPSWWHVQRWAPPTTFADVGCLSFFSII